MIWPCKDLCYLADSPFPNFYPERVSRSRSFLKTKVFAFYLFFGTWTPRAGFGTSASTWKPRSHPLLSNISSSWPEWIWKYIWVIFLKVYIFPKYCHFFCNFDSCFQALFALVLLFQLFLWVNHMCQSQENQVFDDPLPSLYWTFTWNS